MSLALAIAAALLGPPAPPADTTIHLLDSDLQWNLHMLPVAGKASEFFSASWRMRLGAHPGPGYSFVLGSQGDGPDVGPGDYPDCVHIGGCRPFAVAFRTYDPKTDDIFNGQGNIYDRPQREIALYWGGVEVADRLSPAEFRTGDWVPTAVDVHYVTGGAEVTVKVAATPVYDRFFVPEMAPYDSGAFFMASTTGGPPKEHAKLDIDTPQATWSRPVGPPRPPVHVSAIKEALNDAGHTSLVNDVDFPSSAKGVGRVICTLKLDKTPKGLDPWDRCASIYVTDDKGEKIEIVRYITPYSRAYTWKVDVTDYLPLLLGRRKLEVACTTYGVGWLVSVDFDFYKGRLRDVPYKIEKLWSGWVAIGLKEKPESLFFTPKNLTIDRKVSKVKLRFYVTGHGMGPNSDDAAEFMPIKRTAWVDGTPFESLLWKDDNYLNPCRPQGGTWKFDRAGWGPGDVVHPWDIDITGCVKKGDVNEFRYANAPWVNKTPNYGFLAQHWVEAQVISYRR